MRKPRVLVLLVACAVLISCEIERPPAPAERLLVKQRLTAADAPPPQVDAAVDSVLVCSFNIKFLGHLTKKDNEDLATILNGYDIVVIQELVASPVDGTYPDGTAFEADEHSAAFFDEMGSRGFTPILSEEDTGSSTLVHGPGTGTEWWVAFFRSDRVKPADDLPHGFLADDRHQHSVYVRVPYAFAFRTLNDAADFVLVSVHLEKDDRNLRKAELAEIADWVSENDAEEKDFIVLGDMNIHSADELEEACPDGFVSLNAECGATNTSPTGPKPYDHVMYRPDYSAREVDEGHGFWLIDLVETMEDYWQDSHPGETYPGYNAPGDSNLFPQYYSDHNPIEFQLAISGPDDD